MFVIFDLDGTLSDQAHRLPLVTGRQKDYSTFYDLCAKDPPRKPIIATFHAHVAAGHRVEIWTGRTDRVLGITEEWLGNESIAAHHLTRMRREGDYTPDVKLKGLWLAESDVRPSLVYEDRPRMVEFWRDEGIICCDVGGHE